MDCQSCNLEPVITTCLDCGLAMCQSCRIQCVKCGQSICRSHVQITSKGKKLCGPCMEDRRNRQRARKKAQKKEASAVKGVAMGAGSFATLERELDGHDAQAKVAPDSKQNEAADDAYPDDAEKEDKEREEEEVAASAGAVSTGFKSLSGESETVVELELDVRRPVLTSSGYKPPSRLSYTAAFLFFGLAGLIFIGSSPDLRTIMWPFEGSRGIDFNAGATPVIQDTNRLRDGGNISNLSSFVQIPIFLFTWLFLIAYLYGAFVVIRAVIPAGYYWWKRRGFDEKRQP